MSMVNKVLCKTPIRITRDSGANVKLLKELEQNGYIKIYDVVLENGRENKKVKNKIVPVLVLGHARLGECVLNGKSNQYKAILDIIGNDNVKDAMYLEAHFRSGNDYFVTEDKGDILIKKDELEKQLAIKVSSPEELSEICRKDI